MIHRLGHWNRAIREGRDSFRAAKHREVISRCLDAKCWRACSLLKAQFFPHVHLHSSVFERDFVHGNFHQMDPTPAFRAEILNRQGIGYLMRIESSSLIRNDNEDFPAGFATAMNVNRLASLQAIAVEHRVAQCLRQRELDEMLLAANTMRRCGQVHKPVHQR
jgi:hypothetical protein